MASPRFTSDIRFSCFDSNGIQKWERKWTYAPPYYADFTNLLLYGGYLWSVGRAWIDIEGAPRNAAVLLKLDPRTGAIISTIPIAIDTANRMLLPWTPRASQGKLFLPCRVDENGAYVGSVVVRFDIATGNFTGQTATLPNLLRELEVDTQGRIYLTGDRGIDCIDGNVSGNTLPVYWSANQGDLIGSIVLGDYLYSFDQRSLYRVTLSGSVSRVREFFMPDGTFEDIRTDGFGKLLLIQYTRENSQTGCRIRSVNPLTGDDITVYQATKRFKDLVTDRYGTTFISADGFSHDDFTGEFYEPSAPRADAYAVRVGEALVAAAPGVMANDLYTDPNICRVALASPTSHGTVALNPDGSFTYNPVSGYVGADSFTYRVTRGPFTKSGKASISVVNSLSLSVARSTIAGQNFVRGTVGIDLPAAAPTPVSVSTNSPMATVDSPVMIESGQLARSFNIAVKPVGTPTNILITASIGSLSRTQPLTLTPLIPTSIVFSPSIVRGGDGSAAKIIINGVAGAGGLTIQLASSSTHALIPSSVKIPAGGTMTKFDFATSVPPQSVLVQIVASVPTGSKAAYLRINP